MIYLNNAATSFPKPPVFSQAYKEICESLPVHGTRSTYYASPKVASCRELLAELLEVSYPERIVYASNATHALNMGLLGFPWRQGDMVLTTKAEHNSVLRPLWYLQKKGVLHFKELDVDSCGCLQPETLLSALEKFHPRMVVFTHASNVTGAVNDVPLLTETARKYDAAVFIDAAQTAGLIPLKPQLWGADLVAMTGHKYLLGPQGTGALYVSDHINLDPVYTGGTGIHSDEDEMPLQYPMHMEAGTQNESGFALLARMLSWTKENPACPEQMLEYTHILRNTLESLGCKVTSPGKVSTPVLAFTSPMYSPGDLGDILTDSFGIICRTGLHCAPHILSSIGAGPEGTVRFSLSRFTTKAQIDEVCCALKEIFS